MKRLALLTVALTVTAAPAQLLNMEPGVSQPEFGCNLEKGYCVVRPEALQEIQSAVKRRCMGFET